MLLQEARRTATDARGRAGPKRPIIADEEIREIFTALFDRARRSGDSGLRQRSFLNQLYLRAEQEIQAEA